MATLYLDAHSWGGGSRARRADVLSREIVREAALPVLAALDELGRLTRAPSAALCPVAKARLKVQRAEVTRRAKLDPFFTREQALSLLKMRRPFDDQLRQQICDWPLFRVGEDWAGFCRDSRATQAALHELLLAEQRWFATLPLD